MAVYPHISYYTALVNTRRVLRGVGVTALWIVILLVTFLASGVSVFIELHDAKDAAEHLPVDIDRYTRATRARPVSAEQVRETYRRLGLDREEKTNRSH